VEGDCAGLTGLWPGIYLKGPRNTKNDVRFEVFTAVTIKNGVFWDMRIQFVPHRRHITFRYMAQPVNAM
jgi:hypothetical protein